MFGYGIATKHQPGRADATSEDIALRSWKGKWSRYIRVYDTEFVTGTVANGVSLNELMNTLGSDSFASTLRNAARGEGNTDPRRAYMKHPAVELSPIGFDWLRVRLQRAFDEYGWVSKNMLGQLDRPTITNPMGEEID